MGIYAGILMRSLACPLPTERAVLRSGERVSVCFLPHHHRPPAVPCLVNGAAPRVATPFLAPSYHHSSCTATASGAAPIEVQAEEEKSIASLSSAWTSSHCSCSALPPRHTLFFSIFCTDLTSRKGARSISTMAARALTAAGRRVACPTRTTPLLASCRNGVSMNHSSATASARREEEQYKDVRAAAAAMTGAQVEAALNRKNVEVLQGEEHVATVLPDETIGGALDGGEDASWVPDQDTGVFGPAHVDTHGGAAHPAPPHLFGGGTEGSAASVLDQAVFVREEDMEDVERPAAVDMANVNAGVNDSIKNY